MSAMNKLKISIITPSYNQGDYIEQTIQSVLAQDYDHIEHIVIDGGSTDNTVDILRKYPHLIWVSEKDNGQADALCKGFPMATGDIIGWINSDDYYEKNVFRSIATHFDDVSTLWIVGNLNLVNEHGDRLVVDKSPVITFENLIQNPDIIRQPPTFFKRQFIERAGGWNKEFFMVMDFDLWVRAAKIAVPKMIDQHFANFRHHSMQKTSIDNVHRQTREIYSVLIREGVPWNQILKLYLRKQWYALKGRLRNNFVVSHFVPIGPHPQFTKHI